jgi:hypothetical protein
MKRIWHWGIAAAALAGLLCDGRMVVAAESASVDGERVAALIKQLGSDEFSSRERATEQLTKLGLAAYKPLQAAADSPDREVRYRAERILGTIRELDLKRRLEAFLKGQEQEDDYPLPAWSRFRKSYGDESHSRVLFVEMQRADSELLATLDRSPKDAAELLATRVQEQQQLMAQQQRQSPMGLGQIMTLLFVAAESDVSLAAPSLSMVFNFCHQTTMQEALREGTRGNIPRKILGELIERSEDWAAYQAMMLANQHDMKQGLTPALKILTAQGNRVPHMTQYALLTVARMGDRSHLPVVEKLFDDVGVLSKMQESDKVVHEVQVRDAALAAAVHLTKDNIKTYFPAAAKVDTGDQQQLFFNARVIGFANEDDRTAAFEKWANREKDKAGKSAEAGEPKPADKPADAQEPTAAAPAAKK